MKMKNYQEDEVFGILRNNKNENVFIYNIILWELKAKCFDRYRFPKFQPKEDKKMVTGEEGNDSDYLLGTPTS